MGQVVTNGRRVPVLGRSASKPTQSWRGRQHFVNRVGGKRYHVHSFGHAIASFEENLMDVRAHFNVNVSDAFKLALHLTAQAIRQNRALPRVSKGVSA